MPTGYTAELCEKEQSFAFFALGCAKAFGACIEQRDSPISELPKIPEKKVNTYHENAVIAAKADLAKYEAMTKRERKDYGLTCRADDIASNEKSIAEKTVVRNRILGMIEKVEAWTPPTSDHEGLKKFMLEQLNSTLDHDGDTGYYVDELAKAKAKTPGEYYQAAVDHEKWSIKYHEKEAAKEDTRDDGRGKWVSDLYLSLGDDAELAWALLQK